MRAYLVAGLPLVPELIVAMVGVLFALSGRFRTASTGLATLGWVLAVANLAGSLVSLLIVYLVVYRTDGDSRWLRLSGAFSVVLVLLTLGSWACFLVALLREPVTAPSQPGYRPPPPPPPGPSAPSDPQNVGQWSPPRS